MLIRTYISTRKYHGDCLLNDEERRQRNREKSKRWRDKNPGYAAQAVADWREQNPEEGREQWKRQSARRAAKGPRRRNTKTPCVRCGEMDRMPSGNCRPCTIRRNEERKQRHPELVRQQANERIRRYRERMSPDEKKERNQRANLRRAPIRFGLSQDEYDAMEQVQGGLCATCRRPEESGWARRLHIDHDHDTGKVRGLLCGKCNTCLGGFNENIEVM